jgi:predicted transposase YdaD
MTRWDYSASIKYAKEEGVAIGEARGVAIGKAEGVAIGRAEVLDLLAKGYSVEQIKDALNGKLF